MSRLDELKAITTEGWIVITQLCILITLHFCEVTPIFHL